MKISFELFLIFHFYSIVAVKLTKWKGEGKNRSIYFYRIFDIYQVKENDKSSETIVDDAFF